MGPWGMCCVAGDSCFAPAGLAVVTLHEGMNTLMVVIFLCHRSWQPTQGPRILLATQHPVTLDRNSGSTHHWSAILPVSQSTAGAGLGAAGLYFSILWEVETWQKL